MENKKTNEEKKGLELNSENILQNIDENSIIDIDSIGDNYYLIKLEDGLEIEQELTKEKYQELSCKLQERQNLSCTSQDNAIREESYGESGLKPARASESQIIGKKSWQPGAMLKVTNPRPDMGYRFCNRLAPGNIERKTHEGWEYCDEEKLSLDSRTLDHGTEKHVIRDLVLMRMSKDLIKSRREYHESKVIQDRGSENKIKSQLGDGDIDQGGITGTVKIN